MGFLRSYKQRIEVFDVLYSRNAIILRSSARCAKIRLEDRVMLLWHLVAQ